MANFELAYCKERLSACQRDLNKHQTEKAALEGHAVHRLPPTGQSIADATAEIAALTGLVRHYKERVQALEDDDDKPLNTFLASARSKRRSAVADQDEDEQFSKRRSRQVEDDDDVPIGRASSVAVSGGASSGAASSVASSGAASTSSEIDNWVLHTAREIKQYAGVPLVAVGNHANQSIRLAFERHAQGAEPNYCIITKATDTPNSVRVKFLVGPQNFELVPKETNVKFTFKNERNIIFTNENNGRRKTYDVGLNLLLYREHLILVESD
jgi:hypothetical protein